MFAYLSARNIITNIINIKKKIRKYHQFLDSIHFEKIKLKMLSNFRRKYMMS